MKYYSMSYKRLCQARIQEYKKSPFKVFYKLRKSPPLINSSGVLSLWLFIFIFTLILSRRIIQSINHRLSLALHENY